MEDREYLAHIQNAIGRDQGPHRGNGPDAYEADTKTQRAVERNLQIVGDAAHKLSNALKQANADIPWDGYLRSAQRSRPRLLRREPKIVWDILQEDLDPLLAKVTELLKGEAAP